MFELGNRYPVETATSPAMSVVPTERGSKFRSADWVICLSSPVCKNISVFF
jgi:hypothetical protein